MNGERGALLRLEGQDRLDGAAAAAAQLVDEHLVVVGSYCHLHAVTRHRQCVDPLLPVPFGEDGTVGRVVNLGDALVLAAHQTLAADSEDAAPFGVALVDGRRRHCVDLAEAEADGAGARHRLTHRRPPGAGHALERVVTVTRALVVGRGGGGRLGRRQLGP